MHTADVINGSDLMTFDNLHLVRLGDEEGAKLVQVDPEYTIQQADRGRPVVSLPDPQALGMRGALRLASPIIGFTFRADTDLVPVRFTIDGVKPAVTSTTAGVVARWPSSPGRTARARCERSHHIHTVRIRGASGARRQRMKSISW